MSWCAGLALAGVLAACGPSAAGRAGDLGQPAPVGGWWGAVIEVPGLVPGLAALTKGGYAQVNSVSCTSAGSCVAGGSTR
jgi:hypothetical protein